MSKNDEWTEVGGMVENIWDYKELKKGAEFIGVFKNTKTGLGDNNSSLHILEGQDNEEWGVWGCTVLDSRMESLFAGEEIKVLYLGREQPETKGKQPYHNFQVFKKKYTEKQKEDYEKAKEDIKTEEVPF